MPYTVLIHIANEEVFLADIEALPKPTDSVLLFVNPRRRDGKPLIQLDQEAISFAYPWARINFIEVLAERGSRDELVEFFRDE